MDKKTWHITTFSLMTIGALNWGLIGLFDFNLVNSIVGAWPTVERIVYILVGASAVYVFTTHKADCKICGGK